MSGYWLPKHVFLCECGDQIILLDLKKDRYMALNAAHSHSLAGLVRGWPLRAVFPTDPQATLEGGAIALAERMVERGLLTPEQAHGREASPIATASPSSTLVQFPSLLGDDDANNAQLPVRAHHVTALLSGAAVAAAKLRWRALERVVSDVSQRRATRSKLSAPPPDLERARELVAIFRRLRPYVFTAHNACLVDSLSLLNFLSHYRLFPHWVFGVRTAPFAAHCWVQEGETVFNDSIEHVGFYTPIMVA